MGSLRFILYTWCLPVISTAEALPFITWSGSDLSGHTIKRRDMGRFGLCLVSGNISMSMAELAVLWQCFGSDNNRQAPGIEYKTKVTH